MTDADRMSPPPTSWLNGRPLTGFALPRGRLARLMGWLMGRGNLVEQREVLDALAVRPDERVLEVGHGPGALLGLIRDSGATVAGVDPSEAMCAMARRRLARPPGSRSGRPPGSRSGRAGVDVRVGNAEATGHPDRAFDAVVSVNNVPMWSDLDAGLRELRRVLRPGGRLLLAWHGGRTPTRIARRLTLPDDVLDRILERTRTVFATAERRQLDHMEIFRATR